MVDKKEEKGERDVSERRVSSLATILISTAATTAIAKG